MPILLTTPSKVLSFSRDTFQHKLVLITAAINVNINIMKSFDLSDTDNKLDVTLRPSSLSEFIGHKNIVERLNIVIMAARERSDPLAHIIFHGPPGLGKTTLANILAQEMNANILTSSGPAIEKSGDLAGILTNLSDGDILFIDEIHRLKNSIEEYLYSAMENFFLDLMLDAGPNARSVRVSLNKFTLVGATTKIGNLTSPLRSRFPTSVRLEFYDDESLTDIVMRSTSVLRLETTREAAHEIAKRSRGTPRIANNLLSWVRDFAQLNNSGILSKETVIKACNMANIDNNGLDEMDKKILHMMIDIHSGGPVGVKSIAAAIGEEEATISEVVEPFLLMRGFIKRTPRGREVTTLAYKHLGYQV